MVGPLGPYESTTWVWDAHNVILMLMLALSVSMLVGAVVGSAKQVGGAEYGKHVRDASSRVPRISARLAWFLQESPTIFVTRIFVFFVGGNEITGFRVPPNRTQPAPLVLLSMYWLHYVHRTLIHPFLMRGTGKSMSLVPVIQSIAFTALNSYLIASFLSDRGNYPTEWLYDARFIIGALVYAVGFYVNRRCDHILLALREKDKGVSPTSSSSNGATAGALAVGVNAAAAGDDDAFIHPVTQKVYRIPHGNLFEYVSAANYTGESLIWIGFALATFSLEGLSFAILTVGFLGPRAVLTHQWYLDTFGDKYPANRKAFIPFVL